MPSSIPPSIPPSDPSHFKKFEEQGKLGPSQIPSPSPRNAEEMTLKAAIEAALITWSQEPNLNKGEEANRKEVAGQIRKCPQGGKITLYDLSYLSSLPTKALELLKIQSLTLINCAQLSSLTISKKFQSLQKLQIVNCSNMKTLAIEGEHKNLTQIQIDNCKKLTSLSIKGEANNLTQVTLKSTKLISIPKSFAKLSSGCTINTKNCCEEYNGIEAFRKLIEGREERGESVPQWKDETPPQEPHIQDPYSSQG
jgi:Leucine-rich repeat (LRR) protein